MFLESEESIKSATINCSENIVFDDKRGVVVDGIKSEVAVRGNRLDFSKPGRSFEVSANILDGEAFSFGDFKNTVVMPGQAFGSSECETLEERKSVSQHPVEKWFTRKLWNHLFPNVNFGCYEGAMPYSYTSFIDALRRFPSFAAGTVYQQKREMAAFWA
jgi:hypothetical protein